MIDVNSSMLNQGSAKTLNGNIYVLTVYTGNEPWKEKNMSKFDAARDEALQWLSKEAYRYGVNVTFINGNYGASLPIRIEVEEGTGSGNESITIIYDALKRIGYDNPIDFVEWAKTSENCENCLVLLVADKSGRSYAISYMNMYNYNHFFLEGAVLFTRYPDGRSIWPSSIAHEICHLFGAEDLYETFEQTKGNENCAKKLYPDDIMLRVSNNIDELKIDEMSAWFMGLTKVEKPWYEDFLIKR